MRDLTEQTQDTVVEDLLGCARPGRECAIQPAGDGGSRAVATPPGSGSSGAAGSSGTANATKSAPAKRASASPAPARVAPTSPRSSSTRSDPKPTPARPVQKPKPDQHDASAIDAAVPAAQVAGLASGQSAMQAKINAVRVSPVTAPSAPGDHHDPDAQMAIRHQIGAAAATAISAQRTIQQSYWSEHPHAVGPDGRVYAASFDLTTGAVTLQRTNDSEPDPTDPKRSTPADRSGTLHADGSADLTITQTNSSAGTNGDPHASSTTTTASTKRYDPHGSVTGLHSKVSATTTSDTDHTTSVQTQDTDIALSADGAPVAFSQHSVSTSDDGSQADQPIHAVTDTTTTAHHADGSVLSFAADGSIDDPSARTVGTTITTITNSDPDGAHSDDNKVPNYHGHPVITTMTQTLASTGGAQPSATGLTIQTDMTGSKGVTKKRDVTTYSADQIDPTTGQVKTGSDGKMVTGTVQKSQGFDHRGFFDRHDVKAWVADGLMVVGTVMSFTPLAPVGIAMLGAGAVINATSDVPDLVHAVGHGDWKAAAAAGISVGFDAMMAVPGVGEAAGFARDGLEAGKLADGLGGLARGADAVNNMTTKSLISTQSNNLVAKFGRSLTSAQGVTGALSIADGGKHAITNIAHGKLTLGDATTMFVDVAGAAGAKVGKVRGGVEDSAAANADVANQAVTSVARAEMAVPGFQADPTVRAISESVKATIPQGRVWGPDDVETLAHIQRGHGFDEQAYYNDPSNSDVGFHLITTAPASDRARQRLAALADGKPDSQQLDGLVRRATRTFGDKPRQSKFAQGTGSAEIISQVDQAVANGIYSRQGNGFAVDHSFEEPIGTDRNGNPTTWLRIGLRTNGSLATAYLGDAEGPSVERYLDKAGHQGLVPAG